MVGRPWALPMRGGGRTAMIDEKCLQPFETALRDQHEHHRRIELAATAMVGNEQIVVSDAWLRGSIHPVDAERLCAGPVNL